MPETQNSNQIKLNIKTYIENVEDIKHIQYIKALLKKISKLVEEQKQKIIEKLIEYKDNDICDLVQHIPELIKDHEIPLTANGNIRAEIYYSSEYDLDYDLIIDEKYIEIQDSKNNTLERGKTYITFSEWNRICGDWTVKELLEEDEYQPEISIIYIPRTLEEDEYDP